MIIINGRDELYKLKEYCVPEEGVGYIYIIEVGEHVKIGSTADPFWHLNNIINNCGKKTGKIMVSRPHYNYFENEFAFRMQLGDKENEFGFVEAVGFYLRSGLTFEDTPKGMEYAQVIIKRLIDMPMDTLQALLVCMIYVILLKRIISLN